MTIWTTLGIIAVMYIVYYICKPEERKENQRAGFSKTNYSIQRFFNRNQSPKLPQTIRHNLLYPSVYEGD